MRDGIPVSMATVSRWMSSSVSPDCEMSCASVCMNITGELRSRSLTEIIGLSSHIIIWLAKPTKWGSELTDRKPWHWKWPWPWQRWSAVNAVGVSVAVMFVSGDLTMCNWMRCASVCFSLTWGRCSATVFAFLVATFLLCSAAESRYPGNTSTEVRLRRRRCRDCPWWARRCDADGVLWEDVWPLEWAGEERSNSGGGGGISIFKSCIVGQLGGAAGGEGVVAESGLSLGVGIRGVSPGETLAVRPWPSADRVLRTCACACAINACRVSTSLHVFVVGIWNNGWLFWEVASPLGLWRGMFCEMFTPPMGCSGVTGTGLAANTPSRCSERAWNTGWLSSLHNPPKVCSCGEFSKTTSLLFRSLPVLPRLWCLGWLMETPCCSPLALADCLLRGVEPWGAGVGSRANSSLSICSAMCGLPWERATAKGVRRSLLQRPKAAEFQW